jgi:hypothetical protein
MFADSETVLNAPIRQDKPASELGSPHRSTKFSTARGSVCVFDSVGGWLARLLPLARPPVPRIYQDGNRETYNAEDNYGH